MRTEAITRNRISTYLFPNKLVYFGLLSLGFRWMLSSWRGGVERSCTRQLRLHGVPEKRSFCGGKFVAINDRLAPFENPGALSSAAGNITIAGETTFTNNTAGGFGGELLIRPPWANPASGVSFASHPGEYLQLPTLMGSPEFDLRNCHHGSENYLVVVLALAQSSKHRNTTTNPAATRVT